MATRRRRTYEFKPDPSGTNFWKKLYMTRLQRLRLLKWVLYSALCVLLLVVQDVIMSRLRIGGATTDLAVCIILLIAIHEGAETGSLFALLASTVYWFSGSAPGAYAIAFITILTIGATLFRQNFWRKSFGSTALCTALAIMIYEMAVFAAGIFMGRTIWERAGIFALTGLYTSPVMLLLHPLVSAIGKIGGEPWKE